VSEPIREETTVVGLVDGLLVIKRERVWSDGAVLGGEFMCDPQVAGWLADQLERAADAGLSEVTYDAPPDHLVVFVRGGDRGAPINVHVHNRRDPSASHGRTFTLSGMSPAVARQLAADLRAREQ
jgi:hypothetical protein